MAPNSVKHPPHPKRYPQPPKTLGTATGPEGPSVRRDPSAATSASGRIPQSRSSPHRNLLTYVSWKTKRKTSCSISISTGCGRPTPAESGTIRAPIQFTNRRSRTLFTSPSIRNTEKIFEPPELINGRGIPVTGIRPTTIPTFTNK